MTCLQVEGPVAGGLRDFRGLPCDSLVGRTSSRENHLDKIFKIFVLSVLVVFGKSFLFTKLSKISKKVLPYFGDSVAGWSSRMS